MTALSARPAAVSARQIGPIGTTARLVGGGLAIAMPVALHGFSWLEAGIALVALPLIAAAAAPLVIALYRRRFPNVLRMRHGVCSPLGCTLIAVMAGANAALVAPTSANGNVTIWVWLGGSMLLAAARGYGGCEVLAVSNMITGRPEQIGCILYTPIDTAEAKRRARKKTAQARRS